MKRIISVLLVMLSVSMLYAKDATYSVFKKYFDPKADCYEFNARNPFFAGKLYIKNLKQFKNKIIKQTYENYILDEKGLKSYSDSYDRNVSYMYYFFDSEGRITDVFNINLYDDGFISYKEHTSYYCDKSEYVITREDLKRNSSKKITGKIVTDENYLKIQFNQLYNLYNEYQFQKNQIIKRDIRDEKWISLEENYFDEKNVKKVEKIIHNGEKEILREYNYNLCNLVSKETFLQDGNETEIYESTGPETGIIVFAKEGKEKEIHKEYVRKFNSSGFLEYEEIKPYGKAEGAYSITKREILSEKDDFFNEYF